MTTHTISLKDEKAELTPEWLRKVAADPKAVILVAEPKLSMLADALEIADESAWCLIESETLCADREDMEWCDIASASSIAQDAIVQALRYLSARGLLIHHRADASLVRFREIPE